MKKLGTVIYNKLLIQAQEAKEQGLDNLSQRIMDTIGNESSDQKEQYSYTQLKEEINKDLWTVASRMIKFYDLNSVDALKLDKIITVLAEEIIDELGISLEANYIKGANEPDLPGEYNKD